MFKFDSEKIKGGENRREFANIVFDILEDLSYMDGYSQNDMKVINTLKTRAWNHFPMASFNIAWALFNEPQRFNFQNKRILRYIQSETYEAYKNIIK